MWAVSFLCQSWIGHKTGLRSSHFMLLKPNLPATVMSVYVSCFLNCCCIHAPSYYSMYHFGFTMKIDLTCGAKPSCDIICAPSCDTCTYNVWQEHPQGAMGDRMFARECLQMFAKGDVQGHSTVVFSHLTIFTAECLRHTIHMAGVETIL